MHGLRVWVNINGIWTTSASVCIGTSNRCVLLTYKRINYRVHEGKFYSLEITFSKLLISSKTEWHMYVCNCVRVLWARLNRAIDYPSYVPANVNWYVYGERERETCIDVANSVAIRFTYVHKMWNVWCKADNGEQTTSTTILGCCPRSGIQKI